MMTPLPTQIEDADFLVRQRRACLFSEPGTGKTLTALEAWNKVGGRLVVVAPPIALGMWAKNIEDHCGKRVQRIKSGKDKIDDKADAFVMSYAMAGKFFLQPNVLVLDEADALKTLSSERTKAVFGVRCKITQCLAYGVPYVWFLTGTPIRRYADDLYPVLQALWPDHLQKYFGISSHTARRIVCSVTLKAAAAS